jgi:hypothetical protein
VGLDAIISCGPAFLVAGTETVMISSALYPLKPRVLEANRLADRLRLAKYHSRSLGPERGIGHVASHTSIYLLDFYQSQGTRLLP